MDCPYCHNTKCLTGKGIVRIFLHPGRYYLLPALLCILAAIFFSPYFYIASVIIFLLPLAQADMRMYLFLPVLLAHIAGKKVNCPKCNPSGTLFRSEFEETQSRDRFMDD
ncbi:MAG: hypothetical protein IKA79_10010 [Lentisphaeria bacterium]|nr:hypothetical protein [Lentisphaeria bacterium]